MKRTSRRKARKPQPDALPSEESRRAAGKCLAAIGAKSIEELFETIPEKIPAARCVENCLGPLSEAEVIDLFQTTRGRKFALATQAFWGSRRLPAFAFGDYRYDFAARGNF